MKYVYLLTTGDGDDGNEWSVEAIYATREAAERAKVDFDTEKHTVPTGPSIAGPLTRSKSGG